MFKKGQRVQIKSPPDLLLPPSGRIRCEVPDMNDVFMVCLDVPYYGLNYLAINKRWLKAEK
jgi:hypothetical protein